jgi:hypothetical protein
MKKYLLAIALCFTGLVQAAQGVGNLAPIQPELNCLTGIERCIAKPKPLPCPVGKHWSLAGSGLAHCVALDPVCTSGTGLQHDALGNPSCVALPPPSCPSGSSWNGSWTASSCVPDPVACPSGTTWDGSSCKPDVPTCPSGTTWDGSTCAPDLIACPAATTWNGSSCVADPITCPSGQTWDGSMCVVSAVSCPSGSTWNGSTCIVNPVSCPSNTTWDGSTCVANPIVCAAGTIWNGSSCVSTTPTCPSGTTWNGSVCAPIIAPTPPAATCVAPRMMQPAVYAGESPICVRPYIIHVIVNNNEWYPSSSYSAIVPYWYGSNQGQPIRTSDVVGLDQSTPLSSKPLLFLEYDDCNNHVYSLSAGTSAYQSEFVAPSNGYLGTTSSSWCN